MRRIYLADGLSDIRTEDQSIEVLILIESISSVCFESGLSYKEINKALYLADKGLYEHALSKNFSRTS